MRIGILLEDGGYSKLDFSNPCAGNPGVGGTIFDTIMLAYFLNKNCPQYPVTVYHYGNNKFAEGCKEVFLQRRKDVCNLIDGQVDILIVNDNGCTVDFLFELGKRQVQIVVWSHNYMTGEEVECLNSLPNLARVVFVGREQYDHYMCHDIIKKSTYIFNMFDGNQPEYYRNDKLGPVVTYTGSLIHTKGFHMLAHVWKNVLKEVPDAQLNVLGSGKLYDRRNKLGKYNIAEEKYENTFIESLLGEDGQILPSVHFKGVLGQEKAEIYQNTLVGVMNPTGSSETLGMSAIEMEACGIPVVTRRQYGLLDAVVDKETGILINTEDELCNAIVLLLKDRELNDKYGAAGKRYVNDTFQPSVLLPRWVKMFEDIEAGTPAEYVPPRGNYWNDKKWLRKLNRMIRKIIPAFPSMVGFNARKKLKAKYM